MKKILTLSVLSMFVFIFAMSFVLADGMPDGNITDDGPIPGGLEELQDNMSKGVPPEGYVPVLNDDGEITGYVKDESVDPTPPASEPTPTPTDPPKNDGPTNNEKPIIEKPDSDAKVHDPVETPWVVGVMDFFGWGVSWADLIISLAILVMLFAAIYEILSFTAFETPWVKYLIAAGIALITSIVGINRWFAAYMMGFIGNSVILGTGIIIIMAMVFFFIGSMFKGKRRAWGYKNDAKEAEGAFELGATGAAGDVTKTGAVLKEARKK